MHSSRFATLSLAALALGACKREESMARDSAQQMPMTYAEYTIVLRSTWTPANHPFEYPRSGPLSSPHFSGLIGASHNSGYGIFAEGMLPTPGLERLSEEGAHSPLDGEIRAAIAAGTAGALFETGPLRDFGDSLVATVRVDAAHPLVSFVAMIAPSPDWFTGVARINLMEGGSFVESRTLDLYAWDSGGDDGATYRASDRDTNPKRPTTSAMTRHFVRDGNAVPVATVAIRRNSMM
jgi:hypothetical protein